MRIVGGGFGLYGDGRNTFELAVVHGGENWELDYTTDITDDVLGYLTLQEVADTLTRISNLPPK